MSEEVQEEIEVQGPGAILKARRESLQLSIEDIAEKLHLRPAVVAELESDVIDHSVSITFTKGYVRLYAKHMDMDPAPALAAFDKLANPIKQPAKLQSFSQRVAKQASDTRLMILTYSILFAIIAMAVIWWFQQPEESVESTDSRDNVEVTPKEDSQPVPGESQLMSDVAISDVGMTDAASPSDNSSRTGAGSEISNFEPQSDAQLTQTDNISNSIDNVIPTEISGAGVTEFSATDVTETTDIVVTDAPQIADESDNLSANNNLSGSNTVAVNDVERELNQQANEGGVGLVDNQSSIEGSFAADNVVSGETSSTDFPENFGGAEPITQELVFTFEVDCWMNLTDATGENIAYGVKNAGRVMPVSGIPPFEVVLGAPQGVAITVDGVPFDMSRFPAGRTARFMIGAELPASEEVPVQ